MHVPLDFPARQLGGIVINFVRPKVSVLANMCELIGAQDCTRQQAHGRDMHKNCGM